ncbi:hypothetical protein ES705_48686 [subsurface metagenome]
MTVAEAIKYLSDLREEVSNDLSIQECQAIGVALLVLKTLEPSQRAMVDALLFVPVASSN